MSPSLNSLVSVAGLLSMLLPAVSWGEEFDGYTEHSDLVDVATVETGTVLDMLVQEGDPVSEDQPVARLDDEQQKILLRIAAEAMEAQGGLSSALAELQLREQRLAKIIALQENGHARREEVARARADLAIASAQVLTAKEDRAIKRLEHRRIQLQIQRRTIRAPLDGVVTKVHKKKGGYVGPSDPYLVQLVRLDPLHAKFSLPSQRARRMRAGEEATVYFESSRQTVRGKIFFIGPVTDAQSGTVQIKVRIENPEGNYYSGERCTLQLRDPKRTRSAL